MSAGCVRWMLSHTVRAVCGGSRGYWTPASRTTICSDRSNITASSWRRSPLSTAVDDDKEQIPKPKKKKHDSLPPATIGSVGRMIPHLKVQVISETGEELGTMHRTNVIRLMDERGLKLVLLSANKDPPVYQLMSGKQIHEEQLRLRKTPTAKAAPVQEKELTISSDITAHDISTKLKKVEGWLEKKNHVRLTLRSGRRASAADLDTTLEQIVQQMSVAVGFVSKPRTIRDGKAAMCILRPASAKELSQKGKNKAAASQSDGSSSKATENQTSSLPVSNTDTTEGSA